MRIRFVLLCSLCLLLAAAPSSWAQAPAPPPPVHLEVASSPAPAAPVVAIVPAPSSPAPPAEPLQSLLATLIEILAAVWALARTQVVRQIATHFGETAAATAEDRLRAAGVDVALEVEEWAARRAPDIEVAGEAKLAEYVRRLCARLPGVTPDRAIQVAHATLPALELGLAAALKAARAQVELTEPVPTVREAPAATPQA